MSKKYMMFAPAALILTLSSCAGSELRTYDTIDHTDKSMTVPPGGSGLVGSLKDALRANGWRLAVDRGPDVTTGSISGNVNLRQADTFNTRYRMIVGDSWIDYCLPNLQDMFRFDLSVVDNDTGLEVFTLSGRDCEDAIVEQFVAALGQ
jgi:hypothetical protein